jgi:hypothetical protein
VPKKPVKKAPAKKAVKKDPYEPVTDKKALKVLNKYDTSRDNSNQLLIYHSGKLPKDLSDFSKKYGQVDKDNEGQKVVYTGMMHHPKKRGVIVHMRDEDYN